ncbi:MAG: glutathione S-transferase family protein [Alphaproteobacteria bacterium]
MYKLYYAPGTCSLAVHIALNECNQPVTLEKIDVMAGPQRPPEYLKLNPRGAVPLLVDDDLVLREGAAILIHILEKHQSPLLPKSGKERSVAIQWLMIINATLHPAYARVFFLKRNAPEDATKEKLMDVAAAIINKIWGEIEEQLGKTSYLAGDQITIADILMSVIANWNGNVPRPITLGPRTKALLKIVSERSAFKKALAVEGVDYKAA